MPSPAMVGQMVGQYGFEPAVVARPAKKFFRIVQASMGDVAHEREHQVNILAIHILPAGDAFAHEPQHLQTAQNDLMVARDGCTIHFQSSWNDCYTVFKMLMVAKHSST